jgi:hypothetical protein
MADVPDDIDACVAYLVMLNGKEEAARGIPPVRAAETPDNASAPRRQGWPPPRR